MTYLTQIYEMQPGNILFAFSNFVKREPGLFELLVDSGALDKIAQEKLKVKFVVLTQEDLESVFSLHEYCHTLSYNNQRITLVCGFLKFVQSLAKQFIENEVWKNTVSHHKEITTGWFTAIRELLKSVDGEQISLPIDIDWLIHLLKQRFTAKDYEMVEQVLTLLSDIFHHEHIQLSEQLQSYNLVKIFESVWSSPTSI